MSKENSTIEESVISVEDEKEKYPGQEKIFMDIDQFESEDSDEHQAVDDDDLVFVPYIMGAGAFAGCDDEDGPYWYGHYVKRSSIKR